MGSVSEEQERAAENEIRLLREVKGGAVGNCSNNKSAVYDKRLQNYIQ